MSSNNFNSGSTSSTMNMMMMSNHIMNHFNKIQTSNSTLYDTIYDSNFLTQIFLMSLQIFAISIFSAFSNHLTNIFSNSKKIIINIFNKIIIGYILFPIIKIYNYLYKKIINHKQKYKIVRNISLITSELKKNDELLQIIQWFVSSEHCIKKCNDNILKQNIKEIYYPEQNELYKYNFTNNNEKINFNVSPPLTDYFNIIFNNHEIKCFREINKIELNGDLETQKRDNITYYLETYNENENSDILEKFCEYAIKTYNSNRIEWKQTIFTNNHDEWIPSKNSITSSSNIDSVILKDTIKDDFCKSLTFFLNNKNFYKEHGQRYKYVCVLMGPPGTGKTSLALTFSNQNKRNIYCLNFKNSYEGDLKYLIDNMNTETGDLLIDDFDHYFSELGNINKFDKTNNNNRNSDSDSDSKDYKKKNRHKNNKNKSCISYHELLTVLDGTESKDGLIVYICINNPSKLFSSFNIEDFALFRDRRVNKILEFTYCDHKMIRDIYINIFNEEPNIDYIKMIKENYYSPCVIVQQFISFYEKNGGDVINKKKEINHILFDIANNNIETNKDKIKSYINTLKKYNNKNN